MGYNILSHTTSLSPKNCITMNGQVSWLAFFLATFPIYKSVVLEAKKHLTIRLSLQLRVQHWIYTNFPFRLENQTPIHRTKLQKEEGTKQF